jgi:cell pole-organizing protein PopZ
MSNTDQAPEPSMEEILASIRRIISDDENAPAQAAPAPVQAAPEPAAEDESNSQSAIDDIFGDDDNVGDGNADDVSGPDEDITAMMADMEAEMAPEDDVGADDEEDVFDLTNIVSEDALEGEGLVGVDDQDLAFEDPAPPPVEEIAAPEPATAPAPSQDDTLLSPAVAADASAAFGVLANTILSSSGNSRTLEDLVQDMLRPMLKEWLDGNLPELVERLVREEIERVARRGR